MHEEAPGGEWAPPGIGEEQECFHLEWKLANAVRNYIVVTDQVAGSNPVGSTNYGPVAQWIEQERFADHLSPLSSPDGTCFGA